MLRYATATVGILLFLGLCGHQGAYAQAPTKSPSAVKSPQVADAIARALYDRGMVLFREGDTANAKKMFAESLERSPTGTLAEDALRMLKKCNRKLGLDADDGRPAQPKDDQTPLDPYGDTSGKPAPADEVPLDPYSAEETEAQKSTEDGPVDPYGVLSEPGEGKKEGEKTEPPEELVDPYADTQLEDTQPTIAPVFDEKPPQPKQEDNRVPRYAFTTWGATYGVFTGFAATNSLEPSAQIPLALLMGGGSAALAYWYQDTHREMTAGQFGAMTTGGLWGLYNFAFLGDVLTGRDTETGTVLGYGAVGGALGVAAGYLYGKAYDPSWEQLALTNSLSLYGTSIGLLIAVGIEPPRKEAYSLNAVIGSAVGLTAGVILQNRVEVDRLRMLKIDAGAALGAAAPWAVVYPITKNERLAGFLSSASLLGGAYLAWFLTKDDDSGDSSGGSSTRQAPLPALFQHIGDESAGEWVAGVPMLRPMALPEIVPPEGVTIGADLVSGHF